MYDNDTAWRIFITGTLNNTRYEKDSLFIMYRNYFINRMFGQQEDKSDAESNIRRGK